MSNRLQGSLAIDISRNNQSISLFLCIELVIKEMRLPLLVWFDQLRLSSNHIAGFFDHQYLREDVSCFFFVFFLHGDNPQGKIASKTITFDWEGPDLYRVPFNYDLFTHICISLFPNK